MKLTLLQTAVRIINDVRIVETLDEFQSTTYGHGSTTSLSYQTYYDLLINACVRYDKTKKANIGKRRNVYNTNIDDIYVDHPTACLDHVPNSPYGEIVTEVWYFCKVPHPLQLSVRQRLLLGNSVGREQTNQQRMESLVKRHKRLNNEPKFG